MSNPNIQKYIKAAVEQGELDANTGLGKRSEKGVFVAVIGRVKGGLVSHRQVMQFKIDTPKRDRNRIIEAYGRAYAGNS